MGEFDPKKFYIGKLFDSNNQLTDEKLLYNPADLNTHCIILGMTGSGKTGLGILTLEEIAAKGIPAIIIDPKGDLTNLCLHFQNKTNVQGSDLEPWLDPDAPAREGKTLEEYAEEKAAAWRAGYQKWGYTDEDIEALSNVDYTVFTPGSSTGNPIDIMGTFAAPEKMFDKDDEATLDEISTSVTALLGLVGCNDIDPLQSKEHILISNIIQIFWSRGEDVTLEKLIAAIDEVPPELETLGALPVDRIYPKKERFALAMRINNFLASPSFRAWNQGPELNIGSLIRNKDGKPRFNIFYIQHLSDQERMFFVTMLYSQVESWMRQQQGTGNLRLAVYFDEMAGYVPPNGNPSSKGVILRLLKQARAYGVSLILASQNPIDIDYKGLSNAGTWFVGHLQTEQDKNRILDGLSTTEGEINRQKADKLISQLEKRAFVYMNVHTSGLKVVSSRWTLNYLAGPLMKSLIPDLDFRHLAGPYSREDAIASQKAQNGYVEPEEEDVPENAETEANAQKDPEECDYTLNNVNNWNADGIIESPEEELTDTIDESPDGRISRHPRISDSINEYYMPADRRAVDSDGDGSIIYIPTWIAQAEVRAEKISVNFSSTKTICTMIDDEDIRGTKIRWSAYECDPVDVRALKDHGEFPDAEYQVPPLWMTDPENTASFRSDFIDHILRTADVSVRVNKKLNIICDLSEGEEAFLRKCREKAEPQLQAEIDKQTRTIEPKIKAAQTQLDNAQILLENANAVLEQMNSGNIILNKIKQAINSTDINTAERNVGRAEKDIAKYSEQIEKLEADLDTRIQNARAKWDTIIGQTEEEKIRVTKNNIYVDAFGICWMPYYPNSVGKLVRAYD